jgi:hypothetical protein
MPNQVTLTFAGEEKALTDSFSRVGGAAKSMGEKVGSASHDLDDHATGLGKVGDKADKAETNLIGVHDIIDGTATIMQGPGKAGVVAYIQGWADLAGGIAPVVLSLAETKVATIAQTVAQKAAAAGTKIWAGAQWLMNTALLASPITWIVVGIIALVAVIVLIATKTDWFQRAWKASWGWIKKAASDTWEFLKKIPGWIGTAFSKVAGFISAPYKAAFNLIADAWNNTIGKLHFTLPSWIPGIGGNSISVPNLPHFHSGGVVPGVVGTPTVALLQAGERVSSVASGSSSGVPIAVPDGPLVRALVDAVATEVRKRGGRLEVIGLKVA